MEKKREELFQRIDENLARYRAGLMALDKKEIIDRSNITACVEDAHYYLGAHHVFEETELDYLLLFENPLEIIADAWWEHQEDLSDMCFALHSVFDKKDATQEYALINLEQSFRDMLQEGAAGVPLPVSTPIADKGAR